MPAESSSLLEFIEAMKAQGASDESIVALLHQNGWSEKRIYQALGTWYEARTGRTVPGGGGRIEAAKDAFLYLLAFITLGTWTIQLGALLFNAIDQSFPNPAFDYASAASRTRDMAGALASLIVAFPLFLFVSRQIVSGVQQQPERLESGVRKWLTYLALVITASIMIGDAVTFLTYLLRGDLNTRFALRVLVVLVISGGVFAYYLDSLRHDRTSAARNRTFAFAAIIAVFFGIVVGFVHVGSPQAQRVASQDARRIYDLSSLAMGLHQFWSNNATTRGETKFVLPLRIEDVLARGTGAGVSINDPVSGKRYRYTPLLGPNYRLCATFSGPSHPDIPAEWRHPAGYTCFSLDASQNVAGVSPY